MADQTDSVKIGQILVHQHQIEAVSTKLRKGDSSIHSVRDFPKAWPVEGSIQQCMDDGFIVDDRYTNG